LWYISAIMLKRLTVLCALLAITAPSPVFGQAQGKGTAASNKLLRQAGPDASTSPTITLIEKNCDSDRFKNDPDCEKSGKGESFVSVGRLPDANVSIRKNPDRDLPDWVAFGVNIGLAIAGFGGVAVGVFTVLYIRRQTFEIAYQRLLMRRTLAAVRRQSALMETQAEILDKSVLAAQRSAEAANAQIQVVKDKERARVRIVFDDFDLSPSSESGPYRGAFLIRYRLILDGSTQAYIQSGECFAGIRVSEEKLKTRVERLCWLGMMIPDMITTEMREVKGFVALHEEGYVSTIDDSHERIRSVREGKSHVYCEGRVEYRDVFGGLWEIGLQKRWSYFLAALEPSDRLRGRWQSYVGIGSNPDANTERPLPTQY
jgi:hypothetical protein